MADRACGHHPDNPGFNCPECIAAVGLTLRPGVRLLGEKRTIDPNKPRVAKGQPHCPECVEKKNAARVLDISPCECPQDGFCQRYQRQMGGRMREICAGVNVDLGTAASFRDQWKREAEMIASKSKLVATAPRKLLLITDQAPGDAVAMTAAIYSLHKEYPGRYVTAVQSRYPEVFAHNPNVYEDDSGAAELRMHYPAVHDSNERGIHFMQGWCEFLGSTLGVHVPLLTNRPHLYFPDPTPPVEDYWVICSGGKRDFTNKFWGHHNYQSVVDRLAGAVRFIQVGGPEPGHLHPRLSGVEDMIGKTSLRELFDLIRRSRGVVCGVSLPMHVAAALEKPAVIVAGGREPVQWNSYPKQHYLHAVGALPCLSTQGKAGGACWRSRVVPLGDGSPSDEDTCERPVDGFPECMTLIRPSEVSEIVLRYNRQYDYNVDR